MAVSGEHLALCHDDGDALGVELWPTGAPDHLQHARPVVLPAQNPYTFASHQAHQTVFSSLIAMHCAAGAAACTRRYGHQQRSMPCSFPDSGPCSMYTMADPMDPQRGHAPVASRLAALAAPAARALHHDEVRRQVHALRQRACCAQHLWSNTRACGVVPGPSDIALS